MNNLTSLKNTLVLVGNDKKGRQFIHRYARQYNVSIVVQDGSRSIRRVIKLLRRGSLSIPVLLKMTWAELRRPYFRIPDLPHIKTNSELVDIINDQKIEQIVLYHVGLIIRAKVLQTGVEVVNIHSAKLPAYAGLMAIHRALQAHDYAQQTTLHYVNEKVDDGKTITTMPFELAGSKSYMENEDIAFQAGETLLLSFLEPYRIHNNK